MQSVDVRSILAQALLGDAGLADLEAVLPAVVAALPDPLLMAFTAITDDLVNNGIADADRILAKANGNADPLLKTFVALLDDEADREDPNKDAQPGPGLERFRGTDLWTAKLFVHLHGDKVRYCERMGGWFHYDGKRWTRSECGEVERLAKETVRELYSMAGREEKDGKRAAMAKHAAKSEAAGKLAAMLALAATEEEIAVPPEAFDADPWLLNTPGGTIDLRMGQIRPHNPKNFITKMTRYTPDRSAGSPIFDAFLTRIFNGNENIIQFIQRLIGICLSGDISEHVFPIAHGKGANGKTTLLELILHILGDYAATINFATIAMKKHNDGTYNDLAALKSIRFVVVDEGAAGARLNEELVKKITGSKMITARFLFHEFFTYLRAFKIIVVSNHKPKIVGTDHAIWRRVRLIPFDVTIPEEEQDKALGDKMAAEGPAILAWLIEGAVAWQQKGLGVPEEVKAATAQYREEEDPLSDFLADCCIVGKLMTATARELYQAYIGWAEKAGEKAVVQKVFGGQLTERGFDQYRTGTRRSWIGIGLRREGSDVTDDGS